VGSQHRLQVGSHLLVGEHGGEVGLDGRGEQGAVSGLDTHHIGQHVQAFALAGGGVTGQGHAVAVDVHGGLPGGGHDAVLRAAGGAEGDAEGLVTGGAVGGGGQHLGG